VILSVNFKFVFIKGKKVGGTSLEMALSTICGTSDIITPIATIDELERIKIGHSAQNYATSKETEVRYLNRIRNTPLYDLPKLPIPTERYYNHMSLREVSEAWEGDLSDYDIICVERSPYAKILSWANWILSWESYLAGGKLQTDRAALRRSVDWIMENGEFATVRNIEQYRGSDGRVAARPMRYDNLASELAKFLNGLGIERVPHLPHAKKGLLSERLDPEEFFSKKQISIINEVFREEFGTFGYPMLDC
jgi:hypothetical protein